MVGEWRFEIFGHGESWYIGERQAHSNLIRAVTDYMTLKEAKRELRKRLHNKGRKMPETRQDYLLYRLNIIFSESLITSEENELVLSAFTDFINHFTDEDERLTITRTSEKRDPE